MTDVVAAACGRLREIFARTGLSADELRRTAGVSFPDDVGLLNHAPALERLRPRAESAAILIRLFYLETTESGAAIRRVLSDRELELLSTGRLLARTRGGIRARLRLDIVGGRFILADRRFERPDFGALGLPRGDMVYPPGADSAMLAEVVATLDGERVADVCTGSGVQGLVAAAFATRVWMTDINPRAIALAQINAELNCVGHVAASVGDLFRPLGKERFDLVIANPPFVPGPKRGPAYHSGGPRGDRVLRRILDGLGSHLRPGGRAVIISHLALRGGETPDAALASTLRRFQGRVLLVTLDGGTAVDLAAAQSVFALHRGLAAYAREVRDWVAYLSRQRIERIVALLIVAERRGRRQTDVVDASPRTLPIPLSRPPREHVLEWLGRR